MAVRISDLIGLYHEVTLPASRKTSLPTALDLGSLRSRQDRRRSSSFWKPVPRLLGACSATGPRAPPQLWRCYVIFFLFGSPGDAPKGVLPLSLFHVEMGLHQVAPAGLELKILLPEAPSVLRAP